MMKTTREVFKANLFALRKKRFPTQEDFAEKLEMSLRGYQKYEQGESWPTPETLDQICSHLGCTIADLMTDSTARASLSPDHLADVLRAYGKAPPQLRARIDAQLFQNPDYADKALSQARQSLRSRPPKES